MKKETVQVNLSDLKDSLSKDTFGMSVKEAHEKGLCVRCKLQPKFYSELGKREYELSGLCEPCFDLMFGAEEE